MAGVLEAARVLSQYSFEDSIVFVAFDREEHTLGVCAVGVAMHDPLGNAVAISVPVPTQRFTDRQHMIAERLMATKRALEGRMNSAAA